MQVEDDGYLLHLLIADLQPSTNKKKISKTSIPLRWGATHH